MNTSIAIARWARDTGVFVSATPDREFMVKLNVQTAIVANSIARFIVRSSSESNALC
jgi:hypothetical protein